MVGNVGLTRIIGDIHGKWYDYQLLTSSITHNSIQVGDFGIGFNGSYWEDRVNDFHESKQHRFIRGNHDKPETCKNEMVGYIPDGTVENDVMFVGGAWSIDWKYRTDGIDWWRDEELSYNEFNNLIDIYSVAKPRIMITHDCPTLAAYYMFIKEGKTLGGKTLHLTKTGEALQQMFEIHQPDFWFFGHWHHSKTQKIDGTTFICLDELDYIEVDLSDSDVIMSAVEQKFSKGV